MAKLFLEKVVDWVRIYTDEPTITAKYTEDNLYDLIQTEWTTIMEQLNLSAQTPIIVRHRITVVEDQKVYLLPPTIGQVLRIMMLDTNGGVQGEVYPRSRWNPAGCGVAIEGNTLYLDPTWGGSTVYIELDYMPTGDVMLHDGTIDSDDSIVNDVDENTCTVVLAATPDNGSLDTRPNAYAGSILRIISAGTNNYEQMRVIQSYDVATRTATVAPAFTAALLPSVTGEDISYEIAPFLSPGKQNIVALAVSRHIITTEGNIQRYGMITRQYKEMLRSVRLHLANVEQIVGMHFKKDTAANVYYANW